MIDSNEVIKLLDNKRIIITPFDDDRAQIQECSIDLKLFRILRRTVSIGNLVFDPARKQQAFDQISTEQLDMLDSSNTLKGHVLYPTEMILGCTLERVELGSGICGALHLKSTYSRMGLLMGGAGGPVPPGSAGQLTLALTNMGQLPIVLRPNLPICQITFTVSPPTTFLWGRSSKYRNTEGPIPPRALRD